MKTDTEKYIILIKDLLKAGERAILLYGDSGTGKSTLAREAASSLGRTYTQAQCSANTDENSIIGGFVPNTIDNTTEFMFVKKALTQAFEKGYVCIIDELNLAQPDTLSLLNSMLDDVAMLTLDNGEVIYRHPDFQLICTENTGLEGCKYMNAATMNRFYTIKIPSIKLIEIYTRLSNNGIINIDFIDDYLYLEMIGLFDILKSESLDVNNIITYRNHEKMFRLLTFLYKEACVNMTSIKNFMKDLNNLVDDVFTNTFLDVFIENQFEINELLTKNTFSDKKRRVVQAISMYFSTQFDLIDRPKFEDKKKEEKKVDEASSSDGSDVPSKKPSEKKEKEDIAEADEDEQNKDVDTDEEKTKEKEDKSLSMKVDLDVILNEL